MTVNAGDLGADPLEFARMRAAIVRDLWGRLPGAVARPGDPWHVGRGGFSLSFSVYEGAMDLAAKYLGGLYSTRDHIGDPNGRKPFTPVTAARQEEALRFVVVNAFAEEPFRFPAGLVESLGPNRFGEGTDFARPYYSVPSRMLAMQAGLLDRFTHPVLLARILDSAALVPPGDRSFTLDRLFRSLTDGIWGEVLPSPRGTPPSGISVLRRNLQREHLRRLTGLLLGPRGSRAWARVLRNISWCPLTRSSGRCRWMSSRPTG